MPRPENAVTAPSDGSAPVETFTAEEVKSAIRSFLEFGEANFGLCHKGYFSGPGFAARALRFHLGRLCSDNKKGEEPNNADDFSRADKFQPLEKDHAQTSNH